MKYVIIGASAAGINAAKTLRELDKSCEIVIISKDFHVYSRCMLHHVLSRAKTLEEICFIDKDFFFKYNIKWIKDIAVKELNIDKKELLLENNTTEKYDKLLIASGASSFIPPVKNLRESKKVYCLRNYDDLINIELRIATAKKVAVIGAGLVGIDAVIGLMERGLKLSIIEMGDRILPLQLDKKSAEKYEELLKNKGVDIYTSVKLEEVILNKEESPSQVKLSDGRIIDCDMIIVAAGVRPNIDFIKDERLKIDKGINIDKNCSTSVKNIYAAGDVTFTAPIWPIAVKQGITAAYNMAGIEKTLIDNFGLKNSMNFLNLECVSLGIINPPDDSYSVDIMENKSFYKKIIHKDGIIYGALLLGDINYSGVLQYLIKNKVDISKINKDVFHINYSDFFKIREDGQYEYAFSAK